MPLIDYSCPSCQQVREELMRWQCGRLVHWDGSDEPIVCPNCGEEMKRKVSAHAAHSQWGSWRDGPITTKTTDGWTTKDNH